MKIRQDLITNDIQIPLVLKTNYDTTGVTDALLNKIDSEVQKAINPILDTEVMLFRAVANTLLDLRFTSGTNSLVSAGFTALELQKLSTAVQASFVILEVYDGTSLNTQRLLSNQVIRLSDPMLTEAVVSTTTNRVTNRLMKPQLDKAPLASALTCPVALFGTENMLQVYLKISFFNAKTGVRTYFSSKAAVAAVQEVDMYLPLVLNRVTRSYIIATVASGALILNEIPRINNQRKADTPNGTDIAIQTITNRNEFQPLTLKAGFPIQAPIAPEL